MNDHRLGDERDAVVAEFATTAEYDSGSPRLRVIGELDLSTVGHFRRAVESARDGDGHGSRRILIDLSDVSFCDVAGLRALTEAQTAMTDGWSVAYVRTPLLIRRLAKLIGMDGTFDARP